jgi:adenosylcobinamide-GDP ribazoletransferase
MPPLVYETVAWLRFYSCLPIPPLPGETEADTAPDLTRTAHAVPIAGALIGAIGGLVLILAWAMRLPAFLAAALALVTLVIATCARAEQALAASAEQIGKTQPRERSGAQTGSVVMSYGVIALVLAVLVRVGALDGLVTMGTLKAALALVGAGAVSRAAAVSFSLTQPVSQSEGAAVAVQRLDVAALQRLSIVALVVGAVAILPAYGIGSTVVGIGAAIGAAAAVTALSRFAGDATRELAVAAEQAAEIAFLVAVLVFAHSP